MKHMLAVCASLASLIATPAAQEPLGRAVADRDRAEALRHYRLGQDAFRNEHLEVAEREFQTAATLDPTLELAPYGLGQVYMATKRFHPAVAAYQKCREVFLANSTAVLGDQLARERRIDDQIQALEDEQRLYQQPGKNANTAAARANLQNLDMRIRAMKDAKHRTTGGGPEPTPAWLSLALGSAYFRAGRTADAEREYREALKVDPKLGEAHSNLAVVCLVTSRFAEADAEIAAAEKAGFAVNPQLKADVKQALAR